MMTGREVTILIINHGVRIQLDSGQSPYDSPPTLTNPLTRTNIAVATPISGSIFKSYLPNVPENKEGSLYLY